MGKTLYAGAVVYAPEGPIKDAGLLLDGNGVIEAVGGSIGEAVGGVRVIDCAGLSILPGFIDVHVHGGGGYQMMDAAYESLDGMSRFHARHGTTSFLATTGTASHERIRAALHNAARGRRLGLSGAELLGVHLEGPYIDFKRSGAQDKTHIRPPDIAELRQYIDDSDDSIRLVTLAPELPGGLEAVTWLTAKGIAVSIGHSDATYEQVVEAVRCGATHTTHHFNGMSPLHHREPGVAGAGLMLDGLTAELICDGVHVHPAVVKLLVDVKGPDRVCMVTDAVYCAGLPDGDYGHKTMIGGEVYLKDRSSLAGSSLTTAKALVNMMAYTGYAPEKLLPMLTEVPARQIGVSDRKGSLAAGKDADFVIVDSSWQVRATYVRGVRVYGDV